MIIMYFPVLWNPKIFGANKKNGLKQILIDVDCRSTKYGKGPPPIPGSNFRF